MHKPIRGAVIALIAIAGTAILTVGPAATAAKVEGPVEASQAHLRNAAQAYRDGNFDDFVSELETARSLNPASLSTRYNLARGYALTGRTDDALDMLERLVDERVDFGIAEDPDLESLSGTSRFEALVSRAAERTKTVTASEPWLVFEQYGLAPEGIARDPGTGRLFFGSMRTGEIYVADVDKRVSRFATVDRENRLSAVGMTVDVERGLLWAVGSTFDLAENVDADPPARSGLFGFDLDTGDLRETRLVTDDDYVLNDVALGPAGELFATGSRVFIADEQYGVLQPIETGVEVFGSNGITVTPDGDTLIVASYPAGLIAIERDTGAARPLAAPPDTTLYGIDGLYWHDDSLIAIQNGARPWRLLRLYVDDDLTAVTDVEYVEMGVEATTPMTGAIDGSVLYYVGETASPEAPPSQFPATLKGNLGAVAIRRAYLDRQ